MTKQRLPQVVKVKDHPTLSQLVSDGAANVSLAAMETGFSPRECGW